MRDDRLDIDDAPRPSVVKRWAERAAGAWLLACGFAFVLTALATIATFAWPQPTQDQFRLYRSYLELPFPQNVLQVENQHRPIVPGLLRVAEIHLRDADQQLQIAFGVACALATVLLVSLASPRAGAGTATRVAGFAAASMAIFWFGNARMLLHGNELVHTYLVTLAAAVVAFAAWRASRGSPARWLIVGSLAAMVATFSFGPGIALFPALALLAWLGRVPVRAAVIPLFACAACLLLYVFVLPGDDNVRLVLALRPIESALVATRWLASPWVNAWLAYADPPMFAFHADLLRPDYPWLMASANAVQDASGLTWSDGLPLLLGGAGLGVLALALWRAARSRVPMTPRETCSVALMLFGAACAAIIGIARLEFIQQRPDQLFADRYQPWPCLFWLGVVLWLLSSTRRAVRRVTLVVIALLPFALWPTHELGAGWGASVYRSVQATAAAARTDVIDPDVFWRDDPSVLWEDKLRSLQLFRERGLAMFAPAGTRALGDAWQGSLAADASIAAQLTVPVAVHDVRGPLAAVRFEGVVTAGIEHLDSHDVLAVLDPADRLVGYGEPSFEGAGNAKLRWWPIRMLGFDAFIRDYDPATRYRLVALDFASGSGVLLGDVPPP